MSQIILIVITAILAALGGVITKQLVPWLSQKLTAENLEISRRVVGALVAAAEQLRNSGRLSDTARKSWVLDMAEEIGIAGVENFNVDVLIESAVLDLNRTKGAAE